MEKKVTLRYASRLLCLLILTGCSSSLFISPSIPLPTQAPDLQTQSPPTGLGVSAGSLLQTSTVASPPPVGTPHPLLPAPYYTLQVDLDYVAHSLVVNESIHYPNATGQTLPILMLAVEANLWTDCFHLDSLTVGDQDKVSTSLRSDQLEVQLGSPLVPGQTADLALRYSMQLPEADHHHVFGYNNLQVNLVDWYPFVVPYSGGWLLHPIANVGEHLVYDPAIFDVTISLVGAGPPLTIGASAPAEPSGGSWHYLLKNARTFVWSASPDYQSTAARSEGLAITSYYFSQDRTQGLAVLAEVSRAVTTFSSLFGPCPYASLSIVESPFYDGLEYDGLFFISRDFYRQDDGTVLNNMVDIAVHETAHQWWFGSVGNDQALEPWLDEAMATYSEELFYEKNYPQVTAWWAFRVEAYAPTGMVDTDIYQGGDFRSYTNAVYLRGAQFLQALRTRLGDQDFFAFLRDYAAQMAGRRASAEDFFRILRLHTTVSLTDLQQTFFQRMH